ncbi:unnamed protein product, partial [Symbiodinium microadriaticum]
MTLGAGTRDGLRTLFQEHDAVLDAWVRSVRSQLGRRPNNLEDEQPALVKGLLPVATRERQLARWYFACSAWTGVSAMKNSFGAVTSISWVDVTVTLSRQAEPERNRLEEFDVDSRTTGIVALESELAADLGEVVLGRVASRIHEKRTGDKDAAQWTKPTKGKGKKGARGNAGASKRSFAKRAKLERECRRQYRADAGAGLLRRLRQELSERQLCAEEDKEPESQQQNVLDTRVELQGPPQPSTPDGAVGSRELGVRLAWARNSHELNGTVFKGLAVYFAGVGKRCWRGFDKEAVGLRLDMDTGTFAFPVVREQFLRQWPSVRDEPFCPDLFFSPDFSACEKVAGLPAKHSPRPCSQRRAGPRQKGLSTNAWPSQKTPARGGLGAAWELVSWQQIPVGRFLCPSAKREAMEWSEAAVKGRTPPARYNHAAVYLPEQQKMLVFGSSGLDALWILDTKGGIAACATFPLQRFVGVASGRASLGRNFGSPGQVEAELSKMTVKELKTLCKQRSLKVSGKKEFLVHRLVHRTSFEEDLSAAVAVHYNDPVLYLATDGSSKHAVGAMGFTVQKPSVTFAFADDLEDQESYRLEVTAICYMLRALHSAVLCSTSTRPWTCSKVFFVVDCEAALKAIEAGSGFHLVFVLEEIRALRRLLLHRGVRVEPLWTPSHGKRPD